MRRILFLLLVACYCTETNAQTGQPQSPGTGDKTYNTTAGWTENDLVTYVVNDSTPIEELSAIELVVMAPKKFSRKYSYVWGSEGLDHYDWTPMNFLQEGDYFSFPIKVFRYKKDGVREQYSLEGTLIHSEQELSVDSTEFEHLRIEDVSPIFPIDSNFSFVPELTLSDINELQAAGYQVIYNYPHFLEISDAESKMIFDARNMTTAHIYIDGNGKLTDVITDYYSSTETQLVKVKTINQYYRTMPNGRCVLRNTVRTYADLSLNGSTGLEPRHSENIEINTSAHVFPNPTTGEFFLQCTDGTPDNIKIYDMSGKSIRFSVSDNMNQTVKITPYSEVTGMFLVRFTVNGKPNSQKIIKY